MVITSGSSPAATEVASRSKYPDMSPGSVLIEISGFCSMNRSITAWVVSARSGFPHQEKRNESSSPEPTGELRSGVQPATAPVIRAARGRAVRAVRRGNDIGALLELVRVLGVVRLVRVFRLVGFIGPASSSGPSGVGLHAFLDGQDLRGGVLRGAIAEQGLLRQSAELIAEAHAGGRSHQRRAAHLGPQVTGEVQRDHLRSEERRGGEERRCRSASQTEQQKEKGRKSR